jgi:hypothetical protein
VNPESRKSLLGWAWWTLAAVGLLAFVWMHRYEHVRSELDQDGVVEWRWDRLRPGLCYVGLLVKRSKTGSQTVKDCTE